MLFKQIRFIVFLTTSTFFTVHAAEKARLVVDNLAYTHPHNLVEVEPGRKLNIHCVGNGSPTVVFDSGLGDSTVGWALIQPVIAASTQACSYDRAGLGFSDPSTRPGSSANIVDDLHRLLTAANIKPPYILVGHSYGGMNVRLFAFTYPTEVAGMVLVDPSEEDWVESAWKLDPEQKTYQQYRAGLEPSRQEQRECLQESIKGFTEGSELYKQCVPQPDPLFSDAVYAAYHKLFVSPVYQKAVLTEMENVRFASDEQVRAARRWLGDIPLIVLGSSPRPKRKDETQAHRDAINRAHLYLFDQMALQSRRGVVRVVPDSEHYIQMTQPEAVSTAVLEVLNDVRSSKSTPAP